MTTPTSEKRIIQLVSLEYERHPWVDEMYATLFDSLLEKARVRRSKTAKGTISAIQKVKPDVILVIDAGIARPNEEAQEVVRKLKEYTNEGGIVIFGCLFNSFIKPIEMNRLWQEFDLPWKFKSYFRTTLHLNEEAAKNLSLTKSLLKSYSQKAVHLQYVNKENSIYLPNSESVLESFVFPPESVEQDQTPVVWQKYGFGHLGYVGDVNTEFESFEVIKVMCGLL